MDPIMMLIIGLVAGLLIGFIVGRFGKKAMSLLAEAMKMMKQSKAAMPDEPGEGKAIREDEEDEEIDPDKARTIIDGFLDNVVTAGIDDNPDAEFNPVWDFKIRKQKERERLEFRQKMAEEAGTTLDEWDEDDGGGGFGGRANALATLIAAGARVTGVHSAQDAKALAAKEARRKMKSIETFLTKHMDVEVVQIRKDKTKRMEADRKLTVYEKAIETKKNRADGERQEVAIGAAKSSRLQLKELLRRNPSMGGPLKRRATERRRDTEHQGGLSELSKLHQMDADDLQKALEDDDDEGEEGEEGGYDDEFGDDDDGVDPNEDTKKGDLTA